MGPKKPNIGESGRPEVTLERVIAEVHYLHHLAKTERSRRQMALSAFEALVMVGGYWRFESPQKKTDPNWEPAPDALVSVPWWIVDNLARAWLAYLDAPPGKNFGETLDLEGGGQGRHLAKESRKNYRRDLLLALKVHRLRVEAEQKDEKLTLEKAYDNVAASANSTEDIVRLAWRKHGRKLSQLDRA